MKSSFGRTVARRITTVTMATALLLAGAVGTGAATEAGSAAASAAQVAPISANALSSQRALPDNTWWGIVNGESSAAYNEHCPGYEFGCSGDELHKGVDISAETGTGIYAR